MQARWLFSDAVMGKRVTIEVISKVCIRMLSDLTRDVYNHYYYVEGGTYENLYRIAHLT